MRWLAGEHQASDAHLLSDDARCTVETEKAILVVFDEKEVWIPKSVVHDDSPVYAKGHEGEIIVLKWWSEKNGYL